VRSLVVFEPTKWLGSSLLSDLELVRFGKIFVTAGDMRELCDGFIEMYVDEFVGKFKLKIQTDTDNSRKKSYNEMKHLK